jgi:hypothetical protein
VTYLNALSTAAVALFALVELVRANSDRRRRARKAKAQLAVKTDALRRVLGTWLERYPLDASQLQPPGSAPLSRKEKLRYWLGEISPTLEAAETLAADMVDTAVEAPRWIEQRVHTVASHVTSAVFFARSVAARLEGPDEFVEGLFVNTVKQLKQAIGSVSDLLIVVRRPRRLLPRRRRDPTEASNS